MVVWGVWTFKYTRETDSVMVRTGVMLSIGCNLGSMSSSFSVAHISTQTRQHRYRVQNPILKIPNALWFISNTITCYQGRPVNLAPLTDSSRGSNFDLRLELFRTAPGYFSKLPAFFGGGSTYMTRLKMLS